MAVSKAKATANVKTLAGVLGRLDTESGKIDVRLNKALATAYRAGVSAIELAAVTGFTRTNVYDRLKRAGLFARQQPKKEKKAE